MLPGVPLSDLLAGEQAIESERIGHDIHQVELSRVRVRRGWRASSAPRGLPPPATVCLRGAPVVDSSATSMWASAWSYRRVARAGAVESVPPGDDLLAVLELAQHLQGEFFGLALVVDQQFAANLELDGHIRRGIGSHLRPQ